MLREELSNYTKVPSEKKHNMKLLIITVLVTIMTSASQTQPSGQQQNKNVSPFFCDMSVMTQAEREAHQNVGKKIFNAVKELKELRNGYALRLSADSSMIETVAQFIKKERLCC